MNLPELRERLAPYVSPEHIESVVNVFDLYAAPALRAKYDEIVNSLDDLHEGLATPSDGDPEDEKHYRWGEAYGVEEAIRKVRKCKP